MTIRRVLPLVTKRFNCKEHGEVEPYVCWITVKGRWENYKRPKAECPLCRKLGYMAWWNENKEKRRQMSAEYYRINRAECLAAQRRYKQRVRRKRYEERKRQEIAEQPLVVGSK